jgi:hypothetical protein
MKLPEEFRAAIRAKYPHAFSFHRDVAIVLEESIAKPRHLVDEVARTADMLMVQAYKAHASVYFLAVRALIEDAATITRRLLEIAVQAVYITGESDPAESKQRAGRYLAYLWYSMPPEWRQRMSIEERTVWETSYQTYQHWLPARPIRWGPNFSEMFEAVGLKDTYREDYSLLSSIAHGTPPHLVQDYAQPVVPLGPDDFIPMMLVFASRYHLAVADQWNDIFCLIAPTQLEVLVSRAVQFFGGKEPSGSLPADEAP